MWNVIKSQSAFLRDRRGLTLLEYAVIAGVLVTAILGAFTALGGNITAFFMTLDFQHLMRRAG